ncbi:MAG TPA: BlaI/MecI/CopY family transcriptional regulator [Polyangia bacterium]|jgi:predicted transcriptional regulator|nr:BlaI/MecI/CopY family transcriptional regulator [Polyangia bacterium]
MSAATHKVPERLLTESELELMTILWRGAGATAGEVQAALPPERPLAYTSVSTILRILEQKGVVRSEKVGRGHRYLPAVAKGDYEAFALGQVVDKVFDGQPLSLVRRLVDTAGLTRKDLAALKALLDGRGRAKAR